jgi:hypothetical protein
VRWRPMSDLPYAENFTPHTLFRSPPASALRVGPGGLLHRPGLLPEGAWLGVRQRLGAIGTPLEHGEGLARPAPAAYRWWRRICRRRSGWASLTTRTFARIRRSAVRRRQRSNLGRAPSHLSATPPPEGGGANARWIRRFVSSTSMRNGCCPCSFEKLPEGRSRRSAKGLERVEGCALGARTTTNPLFCARQRASQFPLHPYTSRKKKGSRRVPRPSEIEM